MTSLFRLCTVEKGRCSFIKALANLFFLLLFFKTDEVISHIAGQKRACSSDTDVNSHFTFRL